MFIRLTALPSDISGKSLPPDISAKSCLDRHCIVLSLTRFNLHRLRRLAPIAWRAGDWHAVPLGHALFEHEIGWHIRQRGGVLLAD